MFVMLAPPMVGSSSELELIFEKQIQSWLPMGVKNFYLRLVQRFPGVRSLAKYGH